MTLRPARPFSPDTPFARAPELFTPAPLLLTEGEAAWFQTRSGDRLRLGFLPRAAPAPASALTHSPARGTVLLSTGRSEPIEKYAETAADLAARGFDVVLHEWAGQGLSGRYLAALLRAHVPGGAARMLANTAEALRALCPLLPGPWMAVAHSMGGGLTALALAQGGRHGLPRRFCARP